MNHSKLNSLTMARAQKPRSCAATILALFSVLVFASGMALAQSTNGSLSGTVTDASGAVIPGVPVTATNSNTGIVASSTTNGAGVYQFASLQPGTYEISTRSQSFQAATVKNVELQIDARLSIDFSLRVANAQAVVEVSTTLDALKEVGSTVGGVIPNQKLAELPMTVLMNTMTQFVSQLFPSSLEKACSHRGAFESRASQRKRTTIGTPL